MLLISCPWCGPRDESEFSPGGEAHIVRPLEPDQLTDEDWADYVFMRKNPKGELREQWNHSAGCRRWFYVVRDTVTYEISEVYRRGEAPRIKARSPTGSKVGTGKKKTGSARAKATSKSKAGKKDS